tara:strand:- start:309 stop:539 length:231 start_codon:yes stop_codon:yes gene_type:complete
MGKEGFVYFCFLKLLRFCFFAFWALPCSPLVAQPSTGRDVEQMDRSGSDEDGEIAAAPLWLVGTEDATEEVGVGVK